MPNVGLLIAIGIPVLLFGLIGFLVWLWGGLPISEYSPGGESDEERAARNDAYGPIQLGIEKRKEGFGADKRT